MSIKCTTDSTNSNISAVSLSPGSKLSAIKVSSSNYLNSALLPAITVCYMENLFETLPQVKQMVIWSATGGVKSAGTSLFSVQWSNISASGGSRLAGLAVVTKNGV